MINVFDYVRMGKWWPQFNLSLRSGGWLLRCDYFNSESLVTTDVFALVDVGIGAFRN